MRGRGRVYPGHRLCLAPPLPDLRAAAPAPARAGTPTQRGTVPLHELVPAPLRAGASVPVPDVHEPRPACGPRPAADVRG